jgi:D-aspartate ligase
MKKVALLDGQAIQALSVAKSLNKLGFYVVLICDTKKNYGYRTRFADKRIISPSAQKNPIAFHEFFSNLIKNDKIDVTIPLDDASARYLSLYSEELKPYTSFIAPSFEIFMTGYSKNKLMNVCKENNFPHPKSYDLTLNNVNTAAKYVGFPALIKPNETSGARGFAIVFSEFEIKEKLPAIINTYGDCHIQEFIPKGGNQYKVELFILNGSIINSTVIHKIRFYPEKGGSSCFNQTVLKDDLVDMCSRVLKKISWTGFADFDLIEDPRDNVIKIMEINPRVPACIRASLKAGVNFTENIVNGSLGLPVTTYKYNPGSYLRFLGLDLLWFLKSNRRFKTKPFWFKGFLSSKHYLQDGSFDDPLPFVYGTIGGLLKQLDPHFRESKTGMN